MRLGDFGNWFIRSLVRHSLERHTSFSLTVCGGAKRLMLIPVVSAKHSQLWSDFAYSTIPRDLLKQPDKQETTKRTNRGDPGRSN